MFKKLTKVLSFVLVLAMMVTSMASCDFITNLFKCTEHVDENEDFICDRKNCGAVIRLEGNYTYNTYFSTSPKQWNPHTYETANDSTILDYTTLGFYSFDFNDTMDGFEIVPEMAAEMPLDVTSDYVGKWGIEEGDTAKAYLIQLRSDLRWETGERITANDFVESSKRLLDPKAINHRADSLYSGDLAIVGAKDYFYSGSTVISSAASAHKTYSESLDSSLIFTLAPPSEETDNAECYMRTSMGFPASYDAAACANYLISNYLAGSAFTAEAAAAMEGKTLAEIKADPTLAAAWADLIGWWQTEPNEELHFFIYTKTYAETSYDSVGIKAISDTELVLFLESALDGFYLNYALGTDLGLVHIATYDACATVDENGLYTNTYGTSVDTFKSFGPYKLTSFEPDKQFVLETNDQWYGYTDTAYAGQYQTTRIVYDYYGDDKTAFQAFEQGLLDSKSLTAQTIADYTSSERIYYTDGASTWFVAMNPNEAYFSEWEQTHEGYDKSPITVKEFRMALSFSLDRQDYINTLDPMSSIGHALFNSMICSDPENGTMYRSEEAAKDTILEFWGISQDEIGEGKKYPDKDQAIKSITGYNLAGAKALFDQAYDNAVEAGIYDGEEIVQIVIGVPKSSSSYYSDGFEFLKNCWTEAVVGTKFEGKLEFVADTTLTGSNFANSLRTNQTDLLFGVGWTGSALNPFGLIEAYTTAQYQYDRAWNTATAMMDFTVDGVTYTASVLDWTYAINGEKVDITNKADKSVVEYSCGTADADKSPEKKAERINLLAALERAVLNNYDMIPVSNESSASLLGYQVNYGVEDYVYGVGRGGIRYMTYNFTDEEWDAEVQKAGGVINYK